MTCLKCAPILAALMLGVGMAGHAEAHASFQQRKAPANSYFTAELLIPHGCEGKPTTTIDLALPENVLVARPEEKAGWTIDIVKKPLDKPVDGPHGKKITDRIAHIIWRGGSLPDAHYQSFGLIIRTPDLPPGSTLAFPVIQHCADIHLDWTALPGNPKGEPAPTLVISPADPD